MEFRDLIASTPSVAREQSEEARFSFIEGGYVEDLDPQGNSLSGFVVYTLVHLFGTL